MPLLAVHMSVVQEVVDRLGVPELSQNVSAALLGCTAPDRRVVTQQPRQETHYFDLEKDGVGDGLKGLMRSHPEVAADPTSLGWPTRALMIGYVSHLAADEAWIVNVYRPYFANDDYLGTDPEVRHPLTLRSLIAPTGASCFSSFLLVISRMPRMRSPCSRGRGVALATAMRCSTPNGAWTQRTQNRLMKSTRPMRLL